MQSVDLVRIIRKVHDTKAKTAGEKLFFSDPAFYTALGGDLGNAREALVAMLCSYGQYEAEATKDETTGDFVLSKPLGNTISHIKIEVGGSSKAPKQADFVIRDDIDYPGGKHIPLWLLGMMYCSDYLHPRKVSPDLLLHDLAILRLSFPSVQVMMLTRIGIIEIIMLHQLYVIAIGNLGFTLLGV